MTDHRQLFLFIVLILSLMLPFEKAHAQDALSDADYERAEQMLSWNLSDKVFNSSVSPNWVDNHHFWYRTNTRRGVEFRLINASGQSKEQAFDHERLAASMSDITDLSIDPYDLRITGLDFEDDFSALIFQFRGDTWSCSLQTYNCDVSSEERYSAPMSVTSPDGKWAAYQKEYNLWVRNLETGDDIQLTTEGVEHHSFGTNNHGWSRSDRPILTWSPDSRKIATFRLDERDVGMMTLWKTMVGRPEADIWPYALPGDTVVPMLERVVLDVESQEKVWLNVEPDHQRASNCCGLIRGGQWTDIEWSADGEHLAFVSTSRDYKDVKLRVADPESGEVTEIFEDRDEIFFESNLTSRGFPNWRVLHDSSEFIWFNRSDNWGHLYLHDLQSGELKNRITGGDWNVVDILHVDEENRTIHFTAVAVEEDRDPYHEYLYRINFDGSGMELLTPVEAHHSVSLSPDHSYIVNTFSDFETPQKTVLRDADGNELMTIEEADIEDLLATGWKKPVPIRAKARDGETDIYGIMILPTDFDENKSYPIINAIYPGPQAGSVGSRHFSPTRRGQAQALAELGFVVVAIDALGSSPIRSREFHTAYAGDMVDNGLPDQIAAMRQLAEEYSFIDIERAGIYGHSGGGFATAAALTMHPEFFKVGVSGAGNHDNRGYTYYWGEKYQGLLEEENGGDNYEQSAIQLQAENLEGKLLITYGSMDTNVHPGMTLLFVDELIRHNKDFDLIVMPNRGHGYASEPYNIRKTWDYFVEHLAGKTPPKEYLIRR
ncbi:S9 family peptidase [Rhodohalobacter sp. SW132]|uniref:S9 family peptidase n=1 Tax=Rhodohalobacter sp. SW132 TaxID=2293433 RepID=UPI000E26D843|nr:DPP IV N-terminal domain-containing protein [Rhodohalobacter sp. SW132]REL24582.1 S9 family peptidase [Rhodohalobacter sp. SW132]